jgi:hypothetical protein
MMRNRDAYNLQDLYDIYDSYVYSSLGLIIIHYIRECFVH